MGDENLRDSLEAAFEEHAPESSDAPASSTPAAEPASTPSPPSATSTRARDASGRFATAPKDAPAPVRQDAPAPDASRSAPPAKTNGQQDPTAAPPVDAPKPDQFGKAPQSWRPGAREAWSTLPPEVREEVHRRERETQRVTQESAQARQVSAYVQRLGQQFAPALQAEGVDALTASANLMQYASRLRFGTPAEKAQLAAQMVRSYGVDVVALAAALDGQQYAGQQRQPAPGMYQDPRVDQLLAQLQQTQQQREQQVQERAVSDVERFGEGKDFFEDVRADMGDIMELAAKRGIDMSLEQAYERACAMHPEIAKITAAREAAKQAGNVSPSIRRAKAAASSVRGTPVQSSTPPPDDLRGAIEAAIEQVGGR